MVKYTTFNQTRLLLEDCHHKILIYKIFLQEQEIGSKIRQGFVAQKGKDSFIWLFSNWT